MAIVGNPFEDYVKEQITVRQKALAEGLTGSDLRKLSTLKAYNTSTPWMRLTSGVNITDGNPEINGKSVKQILIEKNLFQDFEWEGDQLSKNFVLVGGAANNSNIKPSGKIGPDRSALNGAYGYGYSQEQAGEQRGYVPPPGVTSVNFEYKNDGALAFATVNIKAFSEVQFAIIDILYQRPGYTCLLEFGHSAYLDNNGEYVQADFNTIPFSYIFATEKGQTYFELAKKIQDEKRERDGNYEGFFGRITKFNWKFNSDGSYDITIKLTGTGDVISSLKVNGPKITIEGTSAVTGTKIQPPTEKQKESAEKENSPLIADAIKSQLNFELFCIFKDTKSYPYEANSTISDFTVKNLPIGERKVSGTLKNSVFKVDVNDWGGTDYSPITSIKFSVLLALIQKCCNIKDSKGTHAINFSMLEDIAKDIKEGTTKYDNTYIVTYPGNFSSNPTKCMIKYFAYDDEKLNTEAPQLVKSTVINDKLTRTSNNEDVDNPALAMRLSDVYIDVNFIAQTLKDLRGNDKEVKDDIEIPILDFLKSILSAINTCLGGLNDFRVIYDDQTNFIDIISESPILNAKKEPVDFSVINTFGITKNQGSFVTDMDLNSELTDQFATQLSIGAQANSNTTNGGATSFSTYSKGLVDRLFVEKRSSLEEDLGDENTQTPKEKDIIKEIWSDEAIKAFEQVYTDREFGDDYIPALEGIVSNLAEYIINLYVQIGESPTPLFLPFNLGLTMNGLGGMKIYQGFQVDGKGLPPNYNPSDIQLIIKNLSHSVSLDGWKTKIETLSKPLTKVTVTPTGGKLDESSGEGAGSGSGGSGSGGGQSPSSGGGGKTSPNGYTVGDIYYNGPTSKKQIFIHHTAGGQNIRNVVSGWNKRTDHVSTHFITNNNGQVERIFADEAWANHLGVRSSYFRGFGLGYQNLNKTSLGIEMCSFGGLKLVNGKYRTYVNSTIPANEVARPVDKNGKKTTYKGYTYYHKYSNAHIENVRKIIVGWKNKYGIPFKYDYDTLFTYNKTPFTGAKGIYTHNSVRKDKIDVFPQKELIDMLKSISD